MESSAEPQGGNSWEEDGSRASCVFGTEDSFKGIARLEALAALTKVGVSRGEDVIIAR